MKQEHIWRQHLTIKCFKESYKRLQMTKHALLKHSKMQQLFYNEFI